MARTGKSDEQILVEKGRENVAQKTARRDSFAAKLQAANEKHEAARAKHSDAIDAHVDDPSDGNEKRAHAAASTAQLLAGHVAKAQRDADAAESDLRAAQSDLATAESNLAEADRKREVAARRAELASAEQQLAPLMAALCESHEKQLGIAGAIDGVLGRLAAAHLELVKMGEQADPVRYDLPLKLISEQILVRRPNLATGVMRAFEGGFSSGSASHMLAQSVEKPAGKTFSPLIRNHVLDGGWCGQAEHGGQVQEDARADLRAFWGAPTLREGLAAVNAERKRRQAVADAASFAASAVESNQKVRVRTISGQTGDYK